MRNLKFILPAIAMMALVSSCTKTRRTYWKGIQGNYLCRWYHQP